MEFQSQLANLTDAPSPQDPDGIADLRQGHAKDLLKDKKFIFGKYSVSENGKVRTSFLSMQCFNCDMLGPQITALSKRACSMNICINL